MKKIALITTILLWFNSAHTQTPPVTAGDGSYSPWYFYTSPENAWPAEFATVNNNYIIIKGTSFLEYCNYCYRGAGFTVEVFKLATDASGNFIKMTNGLYQVATSKPFINTKYYLNKQFETIATNLLIPPGHKAVIRADGYKGSQLFSGENYVQKK